MVNTTDPKKTSVVELLNDPNVVTLSVSQACMILGVSKATAHNAYKKTGFLLEGVPVIRVGKRCVVSASLLRTALGLSDPVAG